MAAKKRKTRQKSQRVGFKKLKAKLARRKGVYSPGGLAATIGRKKFGKKGMAKKAAAGRRRASRKRKRR